MIKMVKLGLLGIAITLTMSNVAFSQKKGGTLTIGMDRPMTGFDSSVNPRPEYNRRNAMFPIYEDLFSEGAGGSLVPMLGLSLTNSPDKKNWTVKLKKGLKFSNGEDFNASAYVAHFKRYQSSKAWGFLRGMVGPIKEAVAKDSHTVEFRMLRPFPAFRAILSNPVFPMWANAPQHSAKVGKDLNRQPVGTGPYMLSNWTPGVSLTYVKNPYYRNPDSQYLDKIIFKVIKGELPRLNSVKSGAIDVMLTRDGKTANQAKNDPNLQVLTELVGGTTTIEFNTSKPPLNDIRVRRALAHAVNRRADLKASNDGFGIPSTDWFGPASKWYCEGNTGYPEFNPGKAKGLLRAYGKPVKFKMVTMPIKNFIIGAKLHQTFWKRMGVQVELKVVPPGPAYFRAIRSGRFDAWLVGISEAVDPGLQGQAFFSKNRGNSTKSNFPEVDAALKKAWGSFKDEVKRKAAYCNYVSAVIKHQPILFRAHNNFAIIAGKKVGGLKKSQLTLTRLHEVWLKK